MPIDMILLLKQRRFEAMSPAERAAMRLGEDVAAKSAAGANFGISKLRKIAAPALKPARPLSDVDRLMVTARKLPTACTLAELTVRAWKDWPWHFAIAGHPEHPDLHKTACMVSHKSGPVRRGMLRRVGPNKFCVVEGK